MQLPLHARRLKKAHGERWMRGKGVEILLKIMELVVKNKDELAWLDTLDNGKPISETMTADLPLVIDCLLYYAGLADKIHGETIPVRGDFLNYTIREPVGVVGQIIPWNFPLANGSVEDCACFGLRQYDSPEAC